MPVTFEDSNELLEGSFTLTSWPRASYSYVVVFPFRVSLVMLPLSSYVYARLNAFVPLPWVIDATRGVVALVPYAVLPCT